MGTDTLSHREEFVQSRDGTRIGYRVYGRGKTWLVIANGLGANFEVWDELFRLIEPYVRVVIWHYRGQYSSDRPSDPSATSMAEHCQDLDAILLQEGIQSQLEELRSVMVQKKAG